MGEGATVCAERVALYNGSAGDMSPSDGCEGMAKPETFGKKCPECAHPVGYKPCWSAHVGFPLAQAGELPRAHLVLLSYKAHMFC